MSMFFHGSVECSSLPRLHRHTRADWTPEEAKMAEEIRTIASMFKHVVYWSDESHDEGGWGYYLCTDAIVAWRVCEDHACKCSMYRTILHEYDDRDCVHTPERRVMISVDYSKPIIEGVWDDDKCKYLYDRPEDAIHEDMQEYNR